MKRLRACCIAGAAALALSASALAATRCWPCHPDPFGTKLLSVPGTVSRYVMRGSTIRIDYATSAGCVDSYVWRAGRAQLQTSAPRGCARVAPGRFTEGLAPALEMASGKRIVRVVEPRVGVDRPPRLEVRDRRLNRLLHAWPLPVSPVTLDVAGDIALLSARQRGGLYAVRLSDGRTGFVGVNRGDDMPQVDLAGMVYQDDLSRYSPRHREDQRLLKFVPIAAVRHAIDVAGRPIVTSGRIRAMSMDGPRVALAVSDPRGVCDQIRFWIVAWNFTARLTNETGPTCRVRHAPGGITDVRVAGPRAEWVTTYGGVSTVFSASIISSRTQAARPGLGFTPAERE